MASPLDAPALAPPAVPPRAPSATADAGWPRLASLDVLRGIACVLMAIDHVRVYSGLPAGGDTAGIFLTRWVTHFVAPAFCFLAGTGAFFLAKRLDVGPLRRFLVSRGLLLVLLELTLIRFLWAFQVGPDFLLAGVIWMLGWCMVLLALFVGMPAGRVGWIGLGLALFQQLFLLVPRILPAALAGIVRPWWAFLYPADSDAALGINVLYVLVPWIGVMMMGFGFGTLLERPETARHRLLHRLGLGLTLAFVVLAAGVAIATGGDGDARPLWMRMLDQMKYPASQPFLLMTLGPLIALVPWAERARGWAVRALETFGRVPMWYYLLHLAVIHLAALLVTYARTGAAHGEWFATAPYAGVPEEARWPLWLLYVVWACCIAILYPPCRWYADRKRLRPTAWMRYL